MGFFWVFFWVFFFFGIQGTFTNERLSPTCQNMAAIYKSLSRTDTPKASPASNSVRKNKQRVLILSSRGVTFRYILARLSHSSLTLLFILTIRTSCRHRHLLNDIAALLPHGRKDVKFDSKSKLAELNELAELYNCNNVLYFEARKGKDLYLWLSKAPNGPTVKFHLQNCTQLLVDASLSGLMLGIVHTMEELHFTGNCLKGSRPILSFDAAFEERPHLKVIKKMFLDTFGVPQGARKSKPFIDHVMGFSVADGKIWVRNYQISEEEGSLVKTGDEVGDGKKSKGAAAKPGANTEIKLIEIGPRFVLTPIVIQNGSFGGEIIFANREFVSPNQIRSDLRKAKASRHNARAEQTVERLSRKGELGLRSTSGSKPFENELNHKSVFV